MSLGGQDAVDRALLDRLQNGVPLVPRPFTELGQALGIGEAEVLERVRALKEAGLIRQIGAIFDTRRLGYQSTLVAFCVNEQELEAVAAQVSAHPGVSHNYARPHHYNLWFTLAVPPGQEVGDEVLRLAEQTGTGDWLNLPAERVFKIRTHFGLEGGAPRARDDAGDREFTQRTTLTTDDIPYVRALQRDLPLVARPFAHAAEQLGIREERLVARARELEAAGIMRRFGAVLRHRRIGYRANGMVCWIVPEARIEEAGRRAAEFAAVSHCYQRPAHPPRWPYTLFTMIHGRTRDDVQTLVTQIAGETGIDEYEVLYSTHEFKKERIQYFEPNANADRGTIRDVQIADHEEKR